MIGNRDSYTIKESDRLWPLIEIVRNTWIDDLTDERIQELVAMVDSWRLTDAEGRRIDRTINKCPSCRRMFKDGETCSRGGCPMGGDI